LVTLLGAGAGDLLFRVAARADRLVVVFVVPVVAFLLAAATLAEEVREEREEEELELELEPAPEVPLAAFFVAAFFVAAFFVDLAVFFWEVLPFW
jgi:hypothetical protein